MLQKLINLIWAQLKRMVIQFASQKFNDGILVQPHYYFDHPLTYLC